MIIYSSTKQSFIQDFEQGVLVKKLHQTLTEKYHRVGESEIHSWQASLSYMANVMRDFAIPDLAGVAIEYIVPNTQKRVDFIITGLDQQDKEHVNVNIRMYNFDDVQCTVIPSVAYGFVTGMNLQLC